MPSLTQFLKGNARTSCVHVQSISIIPYIFCDMFACLIPDSVYKYIFSVLNKIILEKSMGNFMALSFLYTYVCLFVFTKFVKANEGEMRDASLIPELGRSPRVGMAI